MPVLQADERGQGGIRSDDDVPAALGRGAGGPAVVVGPGRPVIAARHDPAVGIDAMVADVGGPVQVIGPTPPAAVGGELEAVDVRSEEHTSELQSLMRISYAVFCLK